PGSALLAQRESAEKDERRRKRENAHVTESGNGGRNEGRSEGVRKNGSSGGSN
ncbi:hypothetical protein K0M31_000421, partial [Melipona bicolor]